MPVTVGHQLTATTPDDPAYEIRPSHWNSNHAVTLNVAATEISGLFANSNGVSFGTTNGSITASHNGLTTARASNDAIGLNTAGTNVTWTANSSGLSLNASGYAGTNTAVTGRASLTVNSAGVSFNGTNLAGVGTAVTGAASISLNSSGISFNGSNLAGVGTSITGAASITMNSNGIAFNGSNLAGVGTSATNASITLNSNGLAISVAAPGAAAENNAINLLGANTAGNTTATGSTIGWSGVNLTLSGTNGSQVVVSGPGTSSLSGTGALSISANGSTVSIGVPNLSIYASSNTTAQSSSSSVALGSLTVRGMGGLSVGMSAGELVLSGATGGAGGGVALYDGANSITSGTARFTNANGVSFTFNGQTISGSVNTSYAGSNHSHGNPTLNLTNLSGTTASNSAGFTLSLSANAPGAAAENNAINLLGANTDGNTTASGSTIGWSGINATFSGTNGSQVVLSVPATSSLSATGQLSISTNGSTISIGVPADITLSGYVEPAVDREWLAGQVGNAQVFVQPMNLRNYVQFDEFCMPVTYVATSNLSGSATLSVHVGIYTRNNSTLSQVTSFSNSFGVTNSGTVGSYSLYSGLKEIGLPFTTTMAPGNYYLAILSRTTTGGAAGMTWSNYVASNINTPYAGRWSSAANATNQFILGLGSYTATSAGLPSSIAFSQINGSAATNLRPLIYKLVSQDLN